MDVPFHSTDISYASVWLMSNLLMFIAGIVREQVSREDPLKIPTPVDDPTDHSGNKTCTFVCVCPGDAVLCYLCDTCFVYECFIAMIWCGCEKKCLN